MQQQKAGQSSSSSRSLFGGSKTTAGQGASKGYGWMLGKGKETQQSSSSSSQNSTTDTKENKTAPKPVPPATGTKTAVSSATTSVLAEKKIDPTEYRQVTPAKPVPAQFTPSNKTGPSPPREEYKINQDDDESDGSGTDDEEDDKKKQIPDWAKGQKLRDALENQYGLNGNAATDPDLIFPDVQTCSLEEIFGKKEGKCGK